MSLDRMLFEGIIVYEVSFAVTAFVGTNAIMSANVLH
jgi:hypothetical protein